MILRYQDVSLHTQVVCYLLPPLLDALKGTVVRDGGSQRLPQNEARGLFNRAQIRDREILYLQHGLTQHSPLKHDWKAGPPGHKDLSKTFVLMESSWPQSSLLYISIFTGWFLLLLFKV